MRNCVLACAALIALPLMSQNTSTADNAVWYNARHGDAAAMNQLGVWYYSGNKVDKDYDQAYEWWRRGSMLGNVKAIANLGVCYQYGRGVERDSLTAIQLYVTAIDGGQTELLEQRKANVGSSPFDAMLVGTCYERGIGTQRDIKEAAEMYRLAAAQGSADGALLAADALLSAGKADDALQMYDKAAALGDIEATYMAGKMRMGGMGVPERKEKGMELIRKAADAGLPQAQGTLGTMYLDGNGINKDINRAESLLAAASAAGDQQAMWQYGQLLKNASDYDRALYWMCMGVRAGGIGQFNLMYRALPKSDPFRQYIDGMRSYIKGDYETAARTFKDIDNAHTADGQVMEAAVYADPANHQGNAKKKAKALEKLADKRNAHAAYVLAGMYMDGRGVSRDTHKAISLYRQAANAGYGPAQDALAGIYYEGRNTTIDRSGAKALYDKAYAQRSLSAEGVQRLKEMYADGDPVKAARIGLYDTTDPVKDVLSDL